MNKILIGNENFYLNVNITRLSNYTEKFVEFFFCQGRGIGLSLNFKSYGSKLNCFAIVNNDQYPPFGTTERNGFLIS